MAKYFGHKPAWKTTPPYSGAPTYEPPARTNPNPYNKGTLGRDGMIIPPKSARNPYPRGQSLPGWHGLSHHLPWRGAMRAAAMKLALKGLLGPLGWAELLGDLSFGGEWWQLPGEWQTPDGWTVCPTPSCGLGPDYFQWSGSGATSCSVQAPCAVGQGMSNIGPTANVMENWFVHPTRNLVLFGRHTSGEIGTITARYTLVKQYLKPTGSDGEPWRQGYVVPKTLPKEQWWPKWKEKPFYGPKNRGAPAPEDAPWWGWGPNYPRRGKPVKHMPRPPMPNEVEKKVTFMGGKPYKFYGMLTEFGDMLDCLAKSIPGEPCKGLKMHEKAACVARNHAKVRMEQAIPCMFTEGGRDAAYRFPKIFGKPDPRYYRRPLGPTSGFGYHKGQWSAPSMTAV